MHNLITTKGSNLAAKWRVSVAPVRQRAKERGIMNATELASAAGLAYNTAWRWWNDDPGITRIETDVLIKLCNLLACEPGDLLIRKDLTNND